MDKKHAILNEQKNDGKQLHLYFNEEVRMWIAIGYSAYALRIYSKSCGVNTLKNFSHSMQLPRVFITNDGLAKIKGVLKLANETPGKYVKFSLVESIDLNEFQSWKSHIENNSSSKKRIVIETPVSKYVPKDKYIKDGMSSFARNSKRLFDLFLSFIALVIFSPLFLICYIAIKLDDGGPAIFKQERIGRFGHPFYIYKFRSMKLDAEKKGPQLSASGGEGDNRLTKVGAFLRAHHLDELPQLWNVFCGDMAFVGPRPEREFYINQILDYDKRYEYLYQIRPGVTSYATFYNGYTDTMEKMLRRLEYDLYYLSHRSWYFDMKILAMTFFAIVFGKKF